MNPQVSPAPRALRLNSAKLLTSRFFHIQMSYTNLQNILRGSCLEAVFDRVVVAVKDRF
jgi:hypothetical protein